MNGPALIRTTFAVLAATAAVAAAGCGSTGTSTSTASSTVTGRATPGGDGSAEATQGSAGPTAGPSGAPATGGGSTGGGSTGGNSAPKPATTTRAADTGPSIVYFRVRQSPTCPGGTTANPIAGTPVVVEWKATNVDTVALSVDGPGVYGDGYAPTGAETLNFPCSGKEGDTQRHTYLLTVTNGGGKQTKKLVVSATVHEVTPV